MAEIVAAMALSHAPGLTGWLESATSEQQATIASGFETLRRHLQAAKPDVIVGVANDHMLNLPMKAPPDFCVGTAASWKGPAEFFREWLKLDAYRVDGRPDIAAVLEHRMRAALRELTVRENLVLGAYGSRDAGDAGAALAEVLAQFPILGQRMSQRAGTLSGGEQQQLVIARALMSRPRLVLLDEPTLGLAPMIAARILETVAQLAGAGISILLVEQNAHAALKLAQRAYVLETGRVVLEGCDLLGDARVREAYLGELAASAADPP